MRRDVHNQILCPGDRVRVVSGGFYCNACRGHEGVITHFSCSNTLAFVKFDEPVSGHCLLKDTRGETNRVSCGFYFRQELELVKSMGNDPKQLKIADCIKVDKA